MMARPALVVGENAWQPRKPSSDDEEFDKAILGMLNKLAPQKYDAVISSFDLTRIYKDERKMASAVKNIFEKALTEPSYSQIYVQMCKDILSCPERPEQGTDFRKQIIGFAQNEFDTTMASLASSDGAANDKFKKRQNTNLKFVGELYLAGVLGIRVIKIIVNKLLYQDHDEFPDDTCIEMLCMVLSIVGSTLEEADRPFVDQSMKDIQELLEANVYQPRIKFLLMGILETRALRWVPRVAKAGETNVVLKNKDKEPTPIQRRGPAWGSGDLPRVTSDSKLTAFGSGSTPTPGSIAKRPAVVAAPPPVSTAPQKKPATPTAAAPRQIPGSKSQPTLVGVTPQKHITKKAPEASRLVGDAKTEALRLVVAEVQDVKSTLLTVLWEFCLSGKREDSITSFLCHTTWDPSDIIDAFAVALSMAIAEDAFSDSPKFAERWLRCALCVFPGAPNLPSVCQAIARAVQHFLASSTEEEDDLDDDQSTLIHTIEAMWDNALRTAEKEKVDMTRAVLDGVHGFLLVPGCPGAIIDAVGARAAQCTGMGKESTVLWFNASSVSHPSTVVRMKSYFAVK
jgi:translation initiation factor 4G